LFHRLLSRKLRSLVGAAGSIMLLLLAGCASNGPIIQGNSSPNPQKTAGSSPMPVHTQPAAGNLLKRPITYVALGASDAVGVGSNYPGAQGYVPLVGARLPKGSHIINLGVSGIDLHDALTAELPLALTTSPDLITIWLVANDFIGGVQYSDYMKDLDTLLSQLRARTHAVIVMANLPDLTRLPAFAGQTGAQRSHIRALVEQWNAGIASAAARYGVKLVDLYGHGSELTSHPEYISGDGFHPSPAGYVRLADLFWQTITQG